MGRPIDLAGQKFERLTVLRVSTRRNATGGRFWECQCDCGAAVDASSVSLRNGQVKSCGCFRAETYEALKEKTFDLAGLKFGKLTVLSRAGYLGSSRERPAWLCRCDCGSEKVVQGQSLRQGASTTCGLAPCVDFESRKTAGGLSHTNEAKAAYAHTRRRRAVGSFTVQQIRDLKNSQNGCCNYCKVDLDVTGMHRDHVMPLVLGGANTIDNIQLLCPSCNLKKSFLHPDVFAQKMGIAV